MGRGKSKKHLPLITLMNTDKNLFLWFFICVHLRNQRQMFLVFALVSNRHQLFLFGLRHLFHLFDLVVGQLLDFIEGLALLVFADLFILHRLLDGLVAVAADIADCGAVIFEDLMKLLHHVFAALFGQRGNRDADGLAVILGVQSLSGG